jgi:hypothetical protein
VYIFGYSTLKPVLNRTCTQLKPVLIGKHVMLSILCKKCYNTTFNLYRTALKFRVRAKGTEFAP